MTTAAELASYASSFPIFRNRIINGNLSNPINQRGAASITASTGYTYDRWYYDGTSLYQGIEDKNVNDGTYVISWQGSGFNAYWKLSTDTTANNGPDSTVGFSSALSSGDTFTVSGSGTGNHLWIKFSLDTALDFSTLDKVMVEEGTVATPFEHRPYGTELALCQRYYRTSRAIAGYSYLEGPAIFESASVCHLGYKFTGMRSSPTFTASGTFTGEETGGTLTSTGSGLVGSDFLRISFSSDTNSTAGYSTFIRSGASGNAVFSWSSEL